MIRTTLVALAALALVTTAVPFAQTGAAGVRARTLAILQPVTSGRAVAPAGEALAGLGTRALPELFAFLAEGRIEGGSAAAPAILVLDDLRRLALQSAFARAPRGELTSFLSGLARSPAGERERVTALELLARLGGKGELKLALDLIAIPGAEEPPGPELRAGLEATLSAIVQRDPAGPRVLTGAFARAHPSARSAIANVLAHAGDEAAGLLCGLLGSADSAADGQLLLALTGLDEHQRELADLAARERVHGYLGHPQPELAILACLTAEKLRDHEAVPDLILLLGNDDANLRRSAHSALLACTGLELGPEQAPWVEWLDASLAWWADRATECEAALTGVDPGAAVAALQEVAGQRLFLERVVELILLATRREEPGLVALACRALGSTRTPAAREALIELQDHTDAEVARQARRALAKFHRSPRPPARLTWARPVPLEQ